MDCPKCDSGNVTFIRVVRKQTANIFLYKCNTCNSKYMARSTIRSGKIVKEYYNEA